MTKIIIHSLIRKIDNELNSTISDIDYATIVKNYKSLIVEKVLSTTIIPLLRGKVLQDNMIISSNLLINAICKMMNPLSDNDFGKMLDALSAEEKEELLIYLYI